MSEPDKTSRASSVSIKNLLLLSPLLLAFLLHGAKTGITFLPLFLLSGALFVFFPHRWQLRPALPAAILPFLFYLIWCWMGLWGGAPLDIFLFTYSRAVLYVLVGIMIYQYADDSTPKTFGDLVLALGLIEAGLIILGKIWGRDPQVAGLLRVSLHSGLLLACACSLAISRVRRRDQPLGWTAGYVLVGVAAAAALFLMRARTGLILTGAILLFFYPRKAIWVTVVLMALTAVWISVRGDMILFDLKIDPLGLKGTMARIGIWGTALDAVNAHPFSGCGLGNFETLFRLFQRPSGYGLRYSQTTMFAHNGILQTAAETGLVGALFLLTGIGLIIKRSSHLILKERALVSILIVFLFTSMFNYSLFLPSNGLIFTVAFALMAAKLGENGLGPHEILVSRLRVLPTVVIALLALFLTGFGVSEELQRRGRLGAAAKACPLRSETWYALAEEKLSMNKNALPELEMALETNRLNAFYWQRKALTLIHFKPTEKNQIDHCFGMARALAPFHAPFYVQEGFYRLKRREWMSAQALFKMAASLEPGTTLPRYGLGMAYKGLGRARAARVEFDLVGLLKKEKEKLENDPLHGSPYRQLFGSGYARFLFSVGPLP